MARLLYMLVAWAAALLLVAGCVREEDVDNTPRGNFEALWKLIDEHYCFLDYKGIDWDAVYEAYSPRITDDMTDDGLFEVLGEMLNELKDGHVNLSSALNVSYYDAWYQDYPRNYREDIVEDYYLGKASSDYRTAAGIKYKILDDNIGYARYDSFEDAVGNGNLDEMLSYLAICNGLIFDVRSNGGGIITNSSRIAARFTNEKTLTGYILHKTGTGHSDFSDPYPIYLEPSDGVRWQKPVVVLMNRRSYSATNDFVNAMHCLPGVTLMGDTSGGGSGLPFTSELPNGWSVRFSASPHLDVDMQQIEWGIEPDVKVDMDEVDAFNNIDTIIETARAFLNGNVAAE
ncbi:MAG: S41 family peptidase [Prevotellaceae bacterium]|nr:S41 family peptidase [Prevotellaceae bacterium]